MQTASTITRCCFLLAANALWLWSCATGRPASVPARQIIMEPMHLGVRPEPEIELSSFDAGTLLRAGLGHQREGDCARALPFYRRLLEEFPDSRHRSAAALNAGVCLEELGQADAAEATYRLIVDGLPRSRDWPAAATRLADLLLREQKPQQAAAVWERFVGLSSLATEERLQALAALAEARLAAGQDFQAEKELRRLLALYKEREQEEYLDSALAARAEYLLGQLAEERFRQAPLRLPEEQMEQDLEAKAGLLLEAQSCYLRAIRLADALWATRAGYRIGQLYLELHRALAEAPVPADLNQEETCVYRRLLAERTAVLLRKALRVLEQTLEIADRTGIHDDTVALIREQVRQIEQQAIAPAEPFNCPAPD